MWKKGQESQVKWKNTDYLLFLYKSCILWIYLYSIDTSMHKALVSIISLTFLFGLFPLFGQWQWSNYGSNPLQIVDRVVEDSNEEYRIQDSPLERVDENQGWYPMAYRMTNTLDSIRVNIAIYIQWAIFIGLSLAVVGLIIIGFNMVTNGITSAWTIDKVKKWVVSIIIGVVVLTWFYAFLRLLVAIINSLFGLPGWWTGF